MKLPTRRPVARSTIAMKVGPIACWNASRVAFTASCCDCPDQRALRRRELDVDHDQHGVPAQVDGQARSPPFRRTPRARGGSRGRSRRVPAPHSGRSRPAIRIPLRRCWGGTGGGLPLRREQEELDRQSGLQVHLADQRPDLPTGDLLDDGDELGLHGLLKRRPRRVNVLPFPGHDQRPLGRGEDLLEDRERVIAGDVGLRPRRAPAVQPRVQLHDLARDQRRKLAQIRARLDVVCVHLRLLGWTSAGGRYESIASLALARLYRLQEPLARASLSFGYPAGALRRGDHSSRSRPRPARAARARRPRWRVPGPR